MLEKWDIFCGQHPLLMTRIQVSDPGPNDPLVSLGYHLGRERERELVALLYLCSCCHVTISFLCLFFAVSWVGLWSVIVAFPGHTHLLHDSCVCEAWLQLLAHRIRRIIGELIVYQ